MHVALDAAFGEEVDVWGGWFGECVCEVLVLRLKNRISQERAGSEAMPFDKENLGD